MARQRQSQDFSSALFFISGLSLVLEMEGTFRDH